MFSLASKPVSVEEREENLARAKELKQGKEIFEKLSGKAGPIDLIIKKHAKRLAKGEGQNAATIRREAYQEILAELRKSIPSRQKADGKVSRQPDGASKQGEAPGQERE